jgi:hypothetical protein
LNDGQDLDSGHHGIEIAGVNGPIGQRTLEMNPPE